jgi:hypothetical protein
VFEVTPVKSQVDEQRRRLFAHTFAYPREQHARIQLVRNTPRADPPALVHAVAFDSRDETIPQGTASTCDCTLTLCLDSSDEEHAQTQRILTLSG